MVEAAAIITRFESHILEELVVHAKDRLMLAIRLQAWHNRLLRAEVEVFDQPHAISHERWRRNATREGGSHVRHTGRTSTARLPEDKTQVARAERAARIGTQRVSASLKSLRPERGLGQQQLHNVVDDAVAAEDFELAIGRTPCCSQTRLNLIGPTKVDGPDGGDPDSGRSRQVLFLHTNTKVESQTVSNRPGILNI